MATMIERAATFLGYGSCLLIHGHSLIRAHDFRSQRKCSFDVDIRFDTPTFPSDLSGQR